MAFIAIVECALKTSDSFYNLNDKQYNKSS